MKSGILSVGAMYLDINAVDFPVGSGLVLEKEVVGGEYEVVPGGSAVNFSRVCGAMGLEPIFVGKTGNDRLGDLLGELVEEAGIRPAFIRSDEVVTNVGVNLVGSDGGALMAILGTANQSLSAAEVKERLEVYLPEVEYLYLGGVFKLKSLIPSFVDLADLARRSGAVVVVDHGRVTNANVVDEIELVKKLVGRADYYFPSEEECLRVWGGKSMAEAVDSILGVSQALVVVKLGVEGAEGYGEGGVVRAPAIDVKVVNTVGAGDAFNAGFIKAQTLGKTVEESLTYATATAAVMVSDSDLPTPAKVISLLERNG